LACNTGNFRSLAVWAVLRTHFALMFTHGAESPSEPNPLLDFKNLHIALNDQEIPLFPGNSRGDYRREMIQDETTFDPYRL